MILVTGSLAFDHIMNFPGVIADHIIPEKIHKLNVSFLVDQMHKSFGGTAGNIAYSLSLLGVKVSILAVVGEDFISYRKFLQENEVGTDYISVEKSFFTSTAFGITDAKDNQIWGFYAGADSLSDKLSVKDIGSQIDFGIIAPHNPTAMLKFCRQYKEKGVAYLFDPGMQLPWFQKPDLIAAFAGAKIIIGNDYEISRMQQITAIENLDTLSQQDKIIITTLGADGSKIVSKSGRYQIAAVPLKFTVDPSGAGDAYRAGFTAGFMRGFSLPTCGQMGSVAAAYAVEKYGTTNHSYTIEEFTKRYRENYKQEVSL